MTSESPAGGPIPTRTRRIAGWVAVATATGITSFWAYWGILENFHEGWHYPSLGRNLAMMCVQYLGIMLLFLSVTLTAIRWPWWGGSLFLIGGLWAGWFFRGSGAVTRFLLLVFPLVSLGLLFLWGRAWPRRRAVAVAAGLPILTLVISGAEPTWRVSRRFDDGNREARLVQGNEVRLVWAPAGPGWPADGVPWGEAVRRCRHLAADGRTLADTPQDVWRLPTVDEAVRSLCRNGRHAGGTWDAASGRARYRTTPDKESPLWDVHSPVIYWWTATEVDPDRALRVSYNGHVAPARKQAGFGYLGFRAVRDPSPADPE